MPCSLFRSKNEASPKPTEATPKHWFTPLERDSSTQGPYRSPSAVAEVSLGSERTPARVGAGALVHSLYFGPHPFVAACGASAM